MKPTQKLLALIATFVLTLGGVTLATVPAQAADRDGNCETGEFCYFYNSDNQGSVSDFRNSVADYKTSQPECYEYRGPGNGKGKCIKNDAASVWNRTNSDVTVFYNSNYAGDTQVIKPGEKVNLNSRLKNNNASHRIGGSTPAPSGQWASPVPSNATISAGFGRYPSGGPHNGVDYAYRGDIKSACTGTVDRVAINPTYANQNAYKVSGSTNYVWVNCGGGIRMGYAHFYQRDLPAKIKPGYKIKAGEKITVVGNQGNSSGPHLHFQTEKNGTAINGHQFLKDKGVKGLPAGSGQGK